MAHPRRPPIEVIPPPGPAGFLLSSSLSVSLLLATHLLLLQQTYCFDKMFVLYCSCYSHIGRQGGRQEVSIGRGCEYKATTIHEIMHAIGFYHEQSRRDRDNYITVNFHNIVKGIYDFSLFRLVHCLFNELFGQLPHLSVTMTHQETQCTFPAFCRTYFKMFSRMCKQLMHVQLSSYLYR